MDTLKNILAANGDEKSDVFYLKVFIFLKLAEAMAELWIAKLIEGWHRRRRIELFARVGKVRRAGQGETQNILESSF